MSSPTRSQAASVSKSGLRKKKDREREKSSSGPDHSVSFDLSEKHRRVISHFRGLETEEEEEEKKSEKSIMRRAHRRADLVQSN